MVMQSKAERQTGRETDKGTKDKMVKKRQIEIKRQIKKNNF